MLKLLKHRIVAQRFLFQMYQCLHRVFQYHLIHSALDFFLLFYRQALQFLLIQLLEIYPLKTIQDLRQLSELTFYQEQK